MFVHPIVLLALLGCRWMDFWSAVKPMIVQPSAPRAPTSGSGGGSGTQNPDPPLAYQSLLSLLLPPFSSPSSPLSFPPLPSSPFPLLPEIQLLIDCIDTVSTQLYPYGISIDDTIYRPRYWHSKVSIVTSVPVVLPACVAAWVTCTTRVLGEYSPRQPHHIIAQHMGYVP